MATHSSILAWRIPMDRGTWRATVHCIAKSGHSWVTKHSSSLTVFKSFFFSLSVVLVSFMMVLLSIVSLFSVLAAHWTTWVYGIMDFIKFGKLWAIISINMLYFPFLLCFRDSHDIYWCYSRVYWCSAHYYNYVLFLWFILESFHCYVFKFTSLFFSCLICC